VTTEDRMLALIGRADGLSRIDLAQRLDLPLATATSAVSRLLRRGDLVETPDPARRSKAGRRPGLLRLAGDRPLLGVVSWSPTRLRTTLATFGAEIIERADHPANHPGGDPDRGDARSRLAAPMASLQRSRGGRLSAVVVAVPAPYQRGVGSPQHRRTAPPSAGTPPSWLAAFDGDPAAGWSERLGVPVLFENDANLAMLGEVSAGVARGSTDIVYLKLDARGTGSGLLVGGRIHRGASGFAGELAHVHVDDDGPLCACGGRGCLSMRLGPVLLDSIRAVYGSSTTFADVRQQAHAGDPGSIRILNDVGRTVGRPLADLVTFLNPAAVVIDGSLGPAARFVAEGVREAIERYAAPVATAAVRILVGSLGNEADLHGAVALVRSEPPTMAAGFGG
jgi:predicted NBD/HSP70 family sugar kinase